MGEDATTIANIWPVLLPAIVGGGLALLGVIAGPAINFWLNSRQISNAKRVQNFENLLDILHQQDNWLNTVRLANALGEQREIPAEPLPRAMAIAALYFPQFLPGLNKVDAASRALAHWTTQAGQRRLSGNLTSINEGFSEVYESYWRTFYEVRGEIIAYASGRRGHV